MVSSSSLSSASELSRVPDDVDEMLEEVGQIGPSSSSSSFSLKGDSSIDSRGEDFGKRADGRGEGGGAANCC